MTDVIFELEDFQDSWTNLKGLIKNQDWTRCFVAYKQCIHYLDIYYKCLREYEMQDYEDLCTTFVLTLIQDMLEISPSSQNVLKIVANMLQYIGVVWNTKLHFHIFFFTHLMLDVFRLFCKYNQVLLVEFLLFHLETDCPQPVFYSYDLNECCKYNRLQILELLYEYEQEHSHNLTRFANRAFFVAASYSNFELMKYASSIGGTIDYAELLRDLFQTEEEPSEAENLKVIQAYLEFDRAHCIQMFQSHLQTFVDTCQRYKCFQILDLILRNTKDQSNHEIIFKHVLLPNHVIQFCLLMYL